MDAPAAEFESTEAPAVVEPAAADLDYAGDPPAEAPALDPSTEDQLPAGLRLTRSVDASDRVRRPSVWPVVLTGLLCLALGGAGGWALQAKNNSLTPLASAASRGRPGGPTLPLNPPVLAEVDTAFETVKGGKFADGRQSFTRLAEQHPGWPSMRIEAARAALYEHNFDEAEKILGQLLREGPNTDAEFLTGLLQMTTQAYDKSEAAFGRAVALDPARPDIFYFWGECLRREGKPQDAADKFHEALIRNQYETTEGLYQLKLWLSEIQADQEAAKGSNAKIDTDLASGHPSGAALFAAAARHIRAGQYKQVGERVAQAQKVMDPAVFRVVLQDPLFLQENFHAELAPFYK